MGPSLDTYSCSSHIASGDTSEKRRQCSFGRKVQVGTHQVPSTAASALWDMASDTIHPPKRLPQFSPASPTNRACSSREGESISEVLLKLPQNFTLLNSVLFALTLLCVYSPCTGTTRAEQTICSLRRAARSQGALLCLFQEGLGHEQIP